MRGLQRGGVKADERPRGEQDNGDDGAGYGAGAVRMEGRKLRPVHVRQRYDREHEHAEQQYQCGNRLDALQQRFFENKYQTEYRQYRHRQRDLAEVNVKAGDVVVEAEAEHVAEHRPAEHQQRRCVEKDDGEVRKAEEPRAQKGVISAEGFLGVAVNAAGAGTFFHQIGVVFADHEHHQRADR